MPLTTIWTAYQSGGLRAAADAAPDDAASRFYLALLAFAEEEHGAAAEHAAATLEYNATPSAVQRPATVA